jgi:hypothetical protein
MKRSTPFVVWCISPLLSRNASVCKWTASLRARSRTGSWLRFNAAAARRTDAPSVTSAFNRSSSSGVHGFDSSFISMPENNRADREDGSASQNQDSSSLLRNGWLRFHDRITEMRSIGSEGFSVHFWTKRVAIMACLRLLQAQLRFTFCLALLRSLLRTDHR